MAAEAADLAWCSGEGECASREVGEFVFGVIGGHGYGSGHVGSGVAGGVSLLWGGISAVWLCDGARSVFGPGVDGLSLGGGDFETPVGVLPCDGFGHAECDVLFFGERVGFSVEQRAPE